MKVRPHYLMAMLAGVFVLGIPARTAGAPKNNYAGNQKSDPSVMAPHDLHTGVERLETQQGANGGLPAQLRAPLSPNVDLTGFWYHIRHGKLDAARSELSRLQDENPYWQPPGEATQTLRRLTLKQEL